MPTSAEWLDTLKKVKGFETDSEAAAFLEASRQSASQWRSGKHEMDAATAWMLARAIKVDPLFVIASTAWQQASPDRRERWEALAATCRRTSPKTP